MPLSIQPSTLTSEIALALPSSLGLFEAWGIDYCCGGNRPLEDAAAQAGVALTDVLVELSRLQQQPQDRDWTQAGLQELVDHILDKHHRFTRQAIQSLRPAIAKVQIVHGASHAWLTELGDAAESMFDEIERHLVDEEEVLFPGGMALASGTSNADQVSAVAETLLAVESEHLLVGDTLRHLRTLADGYRPPPGACTTFRAMLAGLDDLEKDLHRHIHLENNLLHPLVRALLPA